MNECLLSDILIRKKDVINVQDEEEYKRITIKMNGNGVVLRDVMIGEKIGTKRQFLVKKGQFILSKIDARNGAFGIVPKSCEHAIITGNFWTFDVNEELANTRFLELLSHTPSFVEYCVKASEGTTNRKYLDEKRFLNQKITLPDFKEQSLLVNKLDKYNHVIQGVKSVRQDLIGDVNILLRSTFSKIIDGAKYKTMAEVAPIVRRKVEIKIDGEYLELGARSFGKGIFHKPTLLGADLEWQKLYTVHKGDLVISNIKAWEGAIAFAGENDHGRVGSHRYITCVPHKNVTTSDFLCFYLLTNEGIEKVQEASPGSADRNRTLAMKRLEKIEVPVPDYDKQLWFNRLQYMLEKIKQAQADNEVELAALMPSILDKAFKGNLV